MKLLTHNLLMCNKKGCTINNFPLKITCESQEVYKINFDQELLSRTLKKIDLPALTQATKDMGLFKFNLEELSAQELANPDIQNFLHHVLFEVCIKDGKLTCNNCNKNYLIQQGVANLVLDDNEVE